MIAVGAPVGEQLVRFLGVTRPLMAGLVLASGSFLMLAAVPLEAARYLPVAVCLAIIGIGMAWLQVAASQLVLGSPDERLAGVAGGAQSAISLLGAATGTVLLSGVLGAVVRAGLPGGAGRAGIVAGCGGARHRRRLRRGPGLRAVAGRHAAAHRGVDRRSLRCHLPARRRRGAADLCRGPRGDGAAGGRVVATRQPPGRDRIAGRLPPSTPSTAAQTDRLPRSSLRRSPDAGRPGSRVQT